MPAHLSGNNGGNGSNGGFIPVKTAFGTYAVGREKIVQVKIGTDEHGRPRCISKPAKLLLAGDEVLIRKDGIPAINIKKIEEALKEEIFYTSNEKMLFTQCGDSYQPTFQIALINGMAQVPEMWPAEISSDPKIRASYENGKPISLSINQAKIASEFIHCKLAEGKLEHPVSATHIQYNWLEGEVIRPQNHVCVVPALIPIAPDIERLISPEFNEAYFWYNNIRRTAVVELNNALRKIGPIKPKHFQQNHHDSNNVHRSVPTELMQFLLGRFASQITQTYVPARVYSVSAKKSPQNGESGHKSNGQKHESNHNLHTDLLFTGIVTENVMTSEISVKPKTEIADEFVILDGVFRSVICHFIAENSYMVPELRPKNQLVIDLFQISKALETYPSPGGNPFHNHASQLKKPDGIPGRVMSQFNLDDYNEVLGGICSTLPSLLHFKERHDAAVAAQIKNLGISRESAFIAEKPLINTTAISKLMSEKILTGAIDTEFGFAKGTIFRLVEYRTMLFNALPTEPFIVLTLNKIIAKKQEMSKGIHAPIIGHREEDKAIQKIFKNREFEEIFRVLNADADYGKFADVLNRNGFEQIAKNPDIMEPLLQG